MIQIEFQKENQNKLKNNKINFKSNNNNKIIIIYQIICLFYKEKEKKEDVLKMLDYREEYMIG